MERRMRLPLCLAPLFVGLVFHLGAAHNAESAGDLVVRTPLGAVRGTTMTSRDNRTIYSFRGLRYAKPPVGELRFMPPVPAKESWDGIKNATEDGASCPQASDSLSGPKSEDCLFLNVYSTKLPKAGRNPRYPVIVFFHQGGWYELSGQSSLLGPQYLMDENIVLVTVNNRLGALGFLSTGDSEVPGNNGLKDQLLALKWVRDNIASFGGNPDSVTIYGYSAGAASVQFHMVSPRSAGLFHRAISSSGSALSGWALTKDPMALTRRLARLLGCPHAESATSKQIVDCLRGKDAEEIAKSYFDLREWQYDPLVIFAPVIEAEGSSDEPFLTEDPDYLFRSGHFTDVPFLTGTVSNEWMRRAAQIIGNETVLGDFSRNFEEIAPILFYYDRGTPASLEKSRKLKEFYFPQSINNNSLQSITDLYTDGAFLYGADRSAKLISSVSSSPVYYYQYVYRGHFGHMPTEPGMEKPPGPVHHDDLITVFYPEGIFPFISCDLPEAIVSMRLTKMWASFAWTGDPTPGTLKKDDGVITITWTPYTPDGLSYLEIGDELVMKQALRQERAAVWNDIYQPAGKANNRVLRTQRKTK